MHLLIPFAFHSAEGCAASLQTLALPNLTKLLARMTPRALERGEDASYSPPHEVALARALGLPEADGQIPWAALQAQPSDESWAFITPCHWEMGSHHVAMSSALLPDFPEQESKDLLAAMQPFFEEDGIALSDDQPGRWLARSSLFDALATASLDRVRGQPVKEWMPQGTGSAKLQRLQTEMQMLLYHHPVNDARSARGVPLVNSFWISGTGRLASGAGPSMLQAPPIVATGLRELALGANWPAWAQAWQSIDATQCAALLAAIEHDGGGQLTLCGESNWQTFEARQRSLRQRVSSYFGMQPPINILLQL